MHDALSSNLSGVHLDSVSAPDSPAVDSVATPVNNSLVPDVKIDVDYNEQESDARHEPAPIKLDKLENASIVPQSDTLPVLGTFFAWFDASSLPHARQDTISIALSSGVPPPPSGEAQDDIKMAEEKASAPSRDVEMSESSSKANGLPNGQTHESPVATPASPLPAVSSSETAVDSHPASSPYAINTNANNDDHDHDKPPPAKRARKYSDAERASLANVSISPLLCAVMGVLIRLFSSRSEDRYSTPSLRLTSSEWQRSYRASWSIDLLHGPVAFLVVHRSDAEEDEGCWSFPRPRRSPCTRHPSLSPSH